MSSTGRPSLPLLSFLKNASPSQGPYNALALTSENVGGGRGLCKIYVYYSYKLKFTFTSICYASGFN